MCASGGHSTSSSAKPRCGAFVCSLAALSNAPALRQHPISEPAADSLRSMHVQTHRAFFIASKLSELPPQVYSPPSSSSEAGSTSVAGTARPLLVLPVPNLAPPLSPSVLLPVLASLNSTPPQTFDISALVLPLPDPALSPSSTVPTPVPLTIPLHPTGLLLYLSQAHYESGSTPLVSWVPCPDQIADGMEQAEGVTRMGQLVSEWQQVGAPRVTVVGAGAGSAGTARPDQVMLGGGQVSEVVMDG